MIAPYWSDGTCNLFVGDCLEVLAGMEAASVDAVVTDPPAAISFMGREWDGNRGGRDQWIAWLAERLEAACRVLKPGGHALVWALPRTAGWTQIALEDAGFEVRDCIPHLFGNGFPKSLDVSKAIDRQRNDRADILRITSWLADIAEAGSVTRAMVDGHMGTSDMGGWWLSRLEHRCAVPTWDQWLKLRTLLGFGDEMDAEVWRLNGRKGTPSEAWGQREVVGAGHRVRRESTVQIVGLSAGAYDITAAATENAARWEGWGTALKPGQEMWWLARKPIRGTVAANVLEHGTGALNIDGCRLAAGQDYRDKCASVVGLGSNVDGDAYGEWTGQRQDSAHDAGRWPPNLVLTHSAPCEARCADDCPVGELDRQSGNASRFFPVFRYEPKAPASERPRGDDGIAHPTVKPVDLMAWLVRLVTPPGGLVLDPFAGSGTTAEACIVEGFRCVLVEKDPAYAALIRTRLRKDIQPAMFGDVS